MRQTTRQHGRECAVANLRAIPTSRCIPSSRTKTDLNLSAKSKPFFVRFSHGAVKLRKKIDLKRTANEVVRKEENVVAGLRLFATFMRPSVRSISSVQITNTSMVTTRTLIRCARYLYHQMATKWATSNYAKMCLHILKGSNRSGGNAFGIDIYLYIYGGHVVNVRDSMLEFAVAL